MCQEKKDEDSLAFKIASIHRCNSKTILRNAEED